MLAFHYESSIHIDAAPETVFALISDPTQHPALAGSGEVLKVRVMTPGPVGLGTRFEADEDIAMGRKHLRFTSTSEIVAYASPTNVSWICMPPSSVKPTPRRIQWWFRLQPDGRGTRLIHEVEVDMGPVVNRLFGPGYRVMRGRTVRRGMEQTLASVKERIEERTRAAV